VTYDVYAYLVWARILGDLGDAAGAEGACKKAREAAKTDRERKQVEEACGK
jgi:hypothetical protein